MSDRVRHLVSAACFGAAMGLLLYWLAVMGISRLGPQTAALQIGSLVLVIIARQIVKPIRNRGWPYGFIALGMFVGASFGFGFAKGMIAADAEDHLSLRELPGFTISLPDGGVTQKLAYGNGHVEIENTGGTGDNLQVQWEPGRLFQDHDVQVLATALAHSADVTFDAPEHGTTAHGDPLIKLRAHLQNGEMAMTWIECGARRVMVMTTGDSDVGGLHQRVVDSFTCHPDPETDAKVGALPWTVDLPASWEKRDAPPGRAHYVDKSTHSMLTIHGHSHPPDRNRVKSQMEPILKAAGISVTFGDWTDDRYPFQASSKGKQWTGFMMPITCNAAGVVVIALCVDPGEVDAVHELVVKAGHCATPAAPIQPMP